MVVPIRSRRAFAALSSSRHRASAGPVWVTRAPAPDGTDLAEPQVAYAISKAVGTAVVRNRIRRRLRAIVTPLDRDVLAPALYLIGVRPAAAERPFAALRDDVTRALEAVSTS